MVLVSDVEFLAHHGVKGQKWGVRRKRDSSGSSGSAAPKKQSRKEIKKEKAAAQHKANVEKANGLMREAFKDPTLLIALNGRTVVTGKEFTDHMSRGGRMEINTTGIFAYRDEKTGGYVRVGG